ncbi:MAG TPA: AraC family transcriptional regulator [Corynebacterium nuruki]|uniref:AraC family transcriptional regulator n=1 Tax=Corynebacterium nuruki TaxID=1032851 RepID=A0A3D4SYQ6_9CORY|nr:AraC family transcriptional regulator [Corynebacterium nuruki]
MLRRIAVIIPEGASALDVTGPAEVFSRADGRDGNHYELVFTSPTGGDVRTTSGIVISAAAAAADVTAGGPVDTVIVAGSDQLTVPAPPGGLLSAVSVLATGARRVAAVSTGTFALAALGLLDGRRATTHWRHTTALHSRYPEILVEEDLYFVRDGRFATSAGVACGMNLALALVEEDMGTAVARSIAQELEVFLHRPGGQAQFASRGNPSPDGSFFASPLKRVTDAVLENPQADHALTSMARTAAVSPRHLGRLFRDELGTTPSRWVERVRVDRARQLLVSGNLPVTTVAELAGFATDEAMRRAFSRILQVTPTSYRKRFATTG